MEENVAKDKEIRWRKIGGGSLRYIRGKIIKPNEVFIARVDEIPSTLRKFVVALEDVPESKTKEEETLLIENEGKPNYEICPSGIGWYDIVNIVSGKPINEKKLRKSDAEKVLKELI